MLFSVGWPRLLSRVLHQSRDFRGSDISLGSQCVCHLRLNVYACGRQKALTMPAYCVAANYFNSQATQNITMHELPRNRPAVKRKWIKSVHFKRVDFDATLHYAHLCSEHLLSAISQILLNTAYQSGIWSQQHFLLCKKYQSRLQNT